MWDLPLPGKRGQRHIPHWFGNAAFAVVGFLCKLFWRYRVDGRQNLRAFKDVSGVLVVCNHTSFLDVVFMYLAARPSQWIRLMGRDSLFDNAGGLLGQALSRVGAFPVKRDSADRTAIKRATRMLKEGELVGVLPEGTRRGRGTAEMKLHSGAAFIARMGKAPILPMTVRNAELVKQKGKWIRFPRSQWNSAIPYWWETLIFSPRRSGLMPAPGTPCESASRSPSAFPPKRWTCGPFSRPPRITAKSFADTRWPATAPLRWPRH